MSLRLERLDIGFSTRWFPSLTSRSLPLLLMLLSFGVWLGLAVLLGLKLPNLGTAVSLAFAILAVSLEVSGEGYHFVNEFPDVDNGGGRN